MPDAETSQKGTSSKAARAHEELRPKRKSSAKLNKSGRGEREPIRASTGCCPETGTAATNRAQ